MKIRAIRFPEGGEERMGKIVNRSNSRPTGKYPSWKMGRMMQWKTVAHLNAFRLLDADSRVSSFQELPMAIEYESKGGFKVEHPDLLVVIGAHKELWTINKLSTTHSQAQKNEMKEFALHLLAHGYRQRLIDVDVLGHEPRLSNAITLLGFGRDEISLLEREALRLLFIERAGRLSWGEVVSGVAGPLGRNILCRLVLEGVVRFDPTALWTDLMIFDWVRAFAFLSDGWQQASLLGEHKYLTNLVRCFNSIFSNWPNGFVNYLQGDNKLTYSNKPSQNFWRKFRGLYRALSQGAWFDRKCNFIFDELIIFGLKNMRGSLYDLIEVEPKTENPSFIPLAKRFNFTGLAEEGIQKLAQLKHILSNVAAARYLGLPQKVLFRLDDEGILDEFCIPGCYKTPAYPWNKGELDNILARLQKILEDGKSKRIEPPNTIHLAGLLARDVLDFEVKVSIVRDILNQKIVAHDMIGSNFGGLILDEDVLTKYIFHRCPKNYRSSISLLDVSFDLGTPRLLVDSLVHLGLLTAIKPDLEVRVLKKSVSQFSEKFIGKESLSKLLCIDEDELSRRIELERVPTLNIPFGDGADCYPLIPKIFIPRLASNF